METKAIDGYKPDMNALKDFFLQENSWKTLKSRCRVMSTCPKDSKWATMLRSANCLPPKIFNYHLIRLVYMIDCWLLKTSIEAQSITVYTQSVNFACSLTRLKNRSEKFVLQKKKWCSRAVLDFGSSGGRMKAAVQFLCGVVIRLPHSVGPLLMSRTVHVSIRSTVCENVIASIALQ